MKEPINIRDTGVSVIDVLRLVSKGCTYEQICGEYPQLTVGDIMASARLAADLMADCVTSDGSVEVDSEIVVKAHGGRVLNLSQIRKDFPRAFEKWTSAEEAKLRDLYQNGHGIIEISRELQRKPGAVKARLEGMGLLK